MAWPSIIEAFSGEWLDALTAPAASPRRGFLRGVTIDDNAHGGCRGLSGGVDDARARNRCFFAVSDGRRQPRRAPLCRRCSTATMHGGPLRMQRLERLLELARLVMAPDLY